jgi:hypothetical protein
MIQSLAHELNFDKSEAGWGKNRETAIRKIFDELPVP